MAALILFSRRAQVLQGGESRLINELTVLCWFLVAVSPYFVDDGHYPYYWVPSGYFGRVTPTQAISCWQQGQQRIVLLFVTSSRFGNE